MKFRFTIAYLIGAVAVSGLWFAALRSGSRVWVNVILDLTVAILLFATVGARFARGPAADRWFGFSAFGWAHLALGALPSFCAQYQVELFFPADLIMAYVTLPFLMDEGVPVGWVFGTHLIVITILTVLSGLIGATLCGFLAARRRDEARPADPTAAPSRPQPD